MPFIPKPEFPNVPKLPGVPQLNRSNFFPPGPPPALTGIVALGRLALAITTPPTWGIYKTSKPDVTQQDLAPEGELPEVVVRPKPPPVLVPDSFSKAQYKQEFDLPTVPIQEGAFASYNKVATPYEMTLRMIKAGSLRERQEFLEKLETIAASLDFYNIVTPERTFVGSNITSWRFVRDGARDAYALTEVEITFVQIREVAAQYTSTAAKTADAANPSAQPVVNKGTLNAATPISRVGATVDAVLAPLRRLSALLGG